jgi:hypothetical protein
MALIECTKCGNKISEFALACPKCGEPKVKAETPPLIPENSLESETKAIPITVKIVPLVAEKTQEGQAEVVSEIQAEIQNPAEKKSNKSKIIVFSIIGVVLIVLILYASGVFNGENQSNQSAPSQDRNYNSTNEGTSESSNEAYEEEYEEEDYEEEEEYETDKQFIEDTEGEDQLSPRDVENNIDYYVKASVDYRQKLITGVYDIQVALKNSSQYMMESVRIEVQYQRINNKVFDTEYLYFTNVGAYSTVTMDAPNKSEGSFVKVVVLEAKVSK